MNTLIKAIMEAKGLTSSHFADEIGVPRPIVSHVLAGRNKPSLDMIQKIARRFPELGTQWILDETVLPEGITLEYTEPVPTPPPVSKPEPAPTMIPTSQPTPVMSHPQFPYNQPPVQPQPIYTQPPQYQPYLSQPQPSIASSPAAAFLAQPPTTPAAKRIEKIVVFYTDKSFDEYTPNS